MAPRRSARLTLASVACGWLLASGPVQAGMTLRLDPAAPGSADVVLEFEADEPGPFTLLRRDVPPGSSVADSLPLDPVADTLLAGITSSPVLLAGEADAAAFDGARVYQLAGAGGACSNAGYVVERRAGPADAPYPRGLATGIRGARVAGPAARGPGRHADSRDRVRRRHRRRHPCP